MSNIATSIRSQRRDPPPTSPGDGSGGSLRGAHSAVAEPIPRKILVLMSKQFERLVMALAGDGQCLSRTAAIEGRDARIDKKANTVRGHGRPLLAPDRIICCVALRTDSAAVDARELAAMKTQCRFVGP
jgi:hypothetical protein